MKMSSCWSSHRNIQGQRTHHLVLLIEQLEAVVLGIHNDHVPDIVADQSGGIFELPHARPSGSERLDVVSDGVEDVHAVQPEVGDVQLAVVEAEEAALRVSFILNKISKLKTNFRIWQIFKVLPE